MIGGQEGYKSIASCHERRQRPRPGVDGTVDGTEEIEIDVAARKAQSSPNLNLLTGQRHKINQRSAILVPLSSSGLSLCCYIPWNHLDIKPNRRSAQVNILLAIGLLRFDECGDSLHDRGPFSVHLGQPDWDGVNTS